MAESTATETPHKPYRRNLHGQYFDGTIGGPGNPHARNVAHLRKTVNEAISPAMVEKVIDSIFQLALTGNIPAARLFLQYAVGKPAPAESPDRVDVEEWQLRKESSVDYAEALPFIHQSPLDCVNMLVRNLRRRRTPNLLQDRHRHLHPALRTTRPRANGSNRGANGSNCGANGYFDGANGSNREANGSFGFADASNGSSKRFARRENAGRRAHIRHGGADFGS